MEVKVGLHCDECIKKILKAIKKIEGNWLISKGHNFCYDDLFACFGSTTSFGSMNNFCTRDLADIETYNVDKQLSKVIVTGNVTTEEVIRVLQKIGKNATPWENPKPQPNCWIIYNSS